MKKLLLTVFVFLFVAGISLAIPPNAAPEGKASAESKAPVTKVIVEKTITSVARINELGEKIVVPEIKMALRPTVLVFLKYGESLQPLPAWDSNGQPREVTYLVGDNAITVKTFSDHYDNKKIEIHILY